MYGENRPKSENLETLAPSSSETELTYLETPWPFDYKWNERYFRKCLLKFFEGTPICVSWPYLVKIGPWKVAEKSSGMDLTTKNSGSAGLVRAPYFALTSAIARKILQALSHLELCMCTDFGTDRLRFAALIPGRWIFRTPISIQSAYKNVCNAMF